MSHPPNSAPSSDALRLSSLDGLRGIAALIVFAHHAMALLYGPLAGISEYAWPARPRLVRTALHTLPVGWMFNGTFAVAFFFVLSGFVLTLAVGQRAEPARVARLMAYRFLRLLPLVIVATLLGYALYDAAVSGLDALRFSAGNDSRAYIAPELLQNHSFAQAIKQFAYTIWRGTRSEVLFDPPLWSIGIELQGSLLIYLLAGAFGQTRQRAAKYIVGIPVGLCLVGPHALSFLAGMYIAERFAKGQPIVRVPDTALRAFVLLATVWASVHPWDRALWLPLPFNIPELLDTSVSALCAVVLIAAGLQLVGLRRLLQSPPIKFLGHASYGLYVVHVPFLYAITGPLFRLLHSRVSYNLAAGATISLVLGLSLAVGAFLVTHVDTPLSRKSKRWVTQWLDGQAR
jgi:peptidoglycan/LPS O-acetylase OafA/YrhL